MKGAIYYASKYGSTRQYARWISDATGLPILRIGNANAKVVLEDLDFLVLGSPVIYHKLIFGKWLRKNLETILKTPVIVFTVSGAPAGAKLNKWIKASLPDALINHMKHVALLGRQDPKDLSRFDRMMLVIAGLANPDRKAGQEELQGFDYMDKANIDPILAYIDAFQKTKPHPPIPANS